jgi:hypothetical protein
VTLELVSTSDDLTESSLTCEEESVQIQTSEPTVEVETQADPSNIDFVSDEPIADSSDLTQVAIQEETASTQQLEDDSAHSTEVAQEEITEEEVEEQQVSQPESEKEEAVKKIVDEFFTQVDNEAALRAQTKKKQSQAGKEK